MKQLALVGLGYTGLPVAVAFADAGLRVVGIDKKKALVAKVKRGMNPFEGEEPDLDDLLRRVVANGSLRATTGFSAVADSDHIVVAVDTSFDEDNWRPDIRNLKACARSVGRFLSRRSLVVIESTVAPGTCEWVVLPILERESGLRGGGDFELAHCPQGSRATPSLLHLRTTDRVVGSLTPEGAVRTMSLYSRIVRADLDATDLVTAEMVESVQSAHTDVNVAFANEVALIAQEVGADAYEVRRLVNQRPGRDMHAPTAGVGGRSLTRDGLLLSSSVHGTLGSVIREARTVNDQMPNEVMRLLEKAFEVHGVEPAGATVVVLGLSFPEGAGDTREAPALRFLEECRKHQIGHRVVDPLVKKRKGLKMYPLTPATFEGADALVLMTRHPAFVEYDYARVFDRMSHPIAVDVCDGFHREYTAMGFHYYGLGRTPTRH